MFVGLSPALPKTLRAATRDIKALGIRYLLINEGDMVYSDMNKYPAFWGVTEQAKANATHLYRID